jgi:hypothetical protein
MYVYILIWTWYLCFHIFSAIHSCYLWKPINLLCIFVHWKSKMAAYFLKTRLENIYLLDCILRRTAHWTEFNKPYTVDNLADTCNFMYKNLQNIFINNIIINCHTFILLLQFSFKLFYMHFIKLITKFKTTTILFMIYYTIWHTHYVHIEHTVFYLLHSLNLYKMFIWNKRVINMKIYFCALLKDIWITFKDNINWSWDEQKLMDVIHT